MASSILSFFRELRSSFLFALLSLIISAFLILFLSSTNPSSRFSDFLKPQLQTQPPHPPETIGQQLPSARNDFDLNAVADIQWRLCKGGAAAVDFIPCLDNWKAIKELKSRRHMEHRERHCPERSPRCLVPLPTGYKIPVLWPKSRDMVSLSDYLFGMYNVSNLNAQPNWKATFHTSGGFQVWYNNVPHPKLVEYKKEQNWVRKSGDYFIFPGGGTQFKDGVTSYIDLIKKSLPAISWGKSMRVILDVGCGVASFGGYLLDRDVLTMSFAPKDEHEAQIQFALERGIPATLSVIGTQKLPFPSNAYDLLHCARCRVHWDADGGKPLLELNRVLRPGGFFIWSATPVYRDDGRDRKVWNSMVALTNAICWKVVAKAFDSSGIGMVVYQKPVSYSCYEERQEQNPPLCDPEESQKTSWYAPLSRCISRLPVDENGNSNNWPPIWPNRLTSKPLSLSAEPDAENMYNEDTNHWATLVSGMYQNDLGLNWSSVRNVMDMNAGYGGFAASMVNHTVWVMNVVPIHMRDTLSIIFDRGLIGIYHDWCESFNTYPRTYDLLHSSFLFTSLLERCNVEGVAAEIDRILRPGGYFLIQDGIKVIEELNPVFRSLHWSTSLYQGKFLVGKKGFWRPSTSIDEDNDDGQ